ncbi:hypothetical protein [Aeromonas hydrophila]|uniref:hypothetical protein n=1 Tax=Aeromonas hydrophila TaxID=644 RepID=UPI003EC6DBB1
MPCKGKSETQKGAFLDRYWKWILLCEVCFVPALITLVISLKNGEMPSTAAVALSTIPITLLGWFASALLNRQNSATQAKNTEINKVIEQIETALKDLSEVCSTAMKSSESKPKDHVIAAQTNVAKVQRVNYLLTRLRSLDSEQEDMSQFLIQLRKLVTDESNFLGEGQLAQTFTQLVRIEADICSRFERRF